MPSIELAYQRLPDRITHFTQEVLCDSHPLLITCQELEMHTPLRFNGQVVLASGYTAIWCILMDALYDIGCIYDLEGRFSGYYCDIILPATRQGTKVSITDLCLDLWVARDDSWTVFDHDEFDDACQQGWIADDTANQAMKALRQLTRTVEQGHFPPGNLRHMTQSPFGKFRTQKGAQDVARSWHRRRSSIV